MHVSVLTSIQHCCNHLRVAASFKGKPPTMDQYCIRCGKRGQECMTAAVHYTTNAPTWNSTKYKGIGYGFLLIRCMRPASSAAVIKQTAGQQW